MQVKRKKSPDLVKPSRGLRLLIVFLFVLLVYLLLALEHNLRPAAQLAAQIKSREICVNIMQKAVKSTLEENPELYETLFSVSQASDGQITGAICNPHTLTALQNTLEDSISKELSKPEQIKVPIPIGTLSGLQLFAGLGPNIPIRAVPLSAVQSHIETNLISGGINQTVLEVDAVFSVEIGTLLAGSQLNERVENRIRIAQFMVVGKVPEFMASSRAF